ncbi:MAG: ABC transporter permease subunit [Solirubrobacterales bacterium]
MADASVAARLARRALPDELFDKSWPRRDRFGLGACWLAGISLVAISAGIVLWLFVNGVGELSVKLLTTDPLPNFDQINSGGIATPIVGTILLSLIGIAIALPLGVAIAVWLTEYGKPASLARAVESAVEVVAGTPSIVLAIFGLAVFSQTIFGFLSFTDEGGAVFGRSFLTSGAIMSLLALPLVVGSVRESLQSVPGHVREASYALGKTRSSTIRRVLLPMCRPGIVTGGALGMGRIIGDTAIVLVLLGGSLTMSVERYWQPGNWFESLQGTGSTLTTYVYGASPAGEGNSPQKAFAAAFMLLLIVLVLNIVVERLTRVGQQEEAT